MTDIVLDENNDITFKNGDLNLFEETDPLLIAQRLEIKLRLNKGEWFLDINQGIPWQQEILSKNNQRNLADTYIRRTIISDEDIKSITQYTATFNNGVYSVFFNATLKDGGTADINLEI